MGYALIGIKITLSARFYGAKRSLKIDEKLVGFVARPDPHTHQAEARTSRDRVFGPFGIGNGS